MHRFTLAVNNVKSGNNDLLPIDIMQLSGHNVQSITNYSTVSQKQQLNMSRTLTRKFDSPFLTRELRACARASYRYDVGSSIRSLARSLARSIGRFL